MRWFLIILALLTAPPAAADFSFLGLKNSLVDFALEQISAPGELELAAEAVEDAEDGATDIVGLTVADGEGVWLSIERLSLRWNPSRVLRGELDIERFAAVGVNVKRAPAPSAVAVEVKEGAAIAETDDDPFDWPRSPIAVRIAEMALERVTIAPEVIAETGLAFDATGAARDEGDEQAMRLTLARTDEVEGRIAVDYLRDFAAESLDLKLIASEAPGGLVAALAGFPATSAMKVDVDAQGPLADWRLTVDANVDDVVAAEGRATVALLDRLAVKGDFSIAPGPALDPTLRTALAPRAALKLDVAEDDAGVIRIHAGEASARDLSFIATGFYDQQAARVDLAVDLEARAGLADLVEGVDFSRFGFDGTVVGTLDDLAAEGRIGLSGLATSAVDVGAADLAATFTVKGDAIAGALDGEASGLRLDRVGPEALGPAELSVSGAYDGATAALSEFSLASPLLTLAASGVANIEANEAALSYELQAPALSPLAAAYDVDADGALTARGELSGPLDAARLVGGLKLSGLEFEGESYGEIDLRHDAVFDETPAGSAAIRAQGSRFGPVGFDGEFEIRGDELALSVLTATGLGAEVSGDARVDLRTSLIVGDVTLNAPDLAPVGAALGEDMRGAARGEVALTYADGAQAADATLALEGFTGFGARLSTGNLTAKLSDALGDPSVAGELRAAGFKGFGVAARAMLVEGGASALGGDDPTLDVKARVDRLDAGGASVQTIDANLRGSLSDLDVEVGADAISAEGASVERVALTGDVIDAASGDPRLDLRLDAVGAAAGGATVARAVVGAKGRLSALDVTASAKGAGPGDEPLSLDLAARADLATETLRASIARFDAGFGEARATLRAPLEVTSRAGTTRLAGLDIGLPGGGLIGDVALHPGGAAGDLTLSIADLTPLAMLAEAPLEQGALELSAVFDTRRGAARADVEARARGVRFIDVVADVGALDFTADLDWDGRVATLDAAVSGAFGEPMRFGAALPMTPSGGLAPTIPQNAPVSGTLDWSGDIGELWALVPAPGHALDGAARIAVAIGGTIQAPEIGGDIALSNGRYENLDVGTILVDLNAMSRIAPGGAFAIDLSAHDGAGEPVKAQVSIADGAVDARVEATGATLVRRDDATAAVSLDISAKGPLTGPAISGRIGIDRAEIRLVDATPPGVADLGPVRIKGAPPPEEDADAGGAIPLDLRIEGPQDIFVRGRGLDSEWRIDLAVTGDAASPVINGVIEKRRGVLNFLGAPLDLARGEIRFFGKPEPDPRIDILLEREKDGVTGGIAVTGTAAEPQINFVSRPSLPESEVLPRILFGRSQQSLSPSEALSLAIGLSTLLDGSGGSIDGVRSAVGVDVLRIEDGGDSGPSVTVGSNVVDGVFVGAKQPIGGGSASVQVEIEIFDDFSIDSETGPDVGTSFGLNWKKDF